MPGAGSVTVFIIDGAGLRLGLASASGFVFRLE
jgi:hypothetical protein